MTPPLFDVSVILPVFNERGHLEQEIDRVRDALDASNYSFEIIVVDDGSTDGSSDRLRGIEGIRLLPFDKNRGTGSARRYGTMAARGRVVVWTDVDMSYPNDRIPELVDNLVGCDQVVGARTSEQGTKRLLRTPAKWLIRKLASFLTETRIPDLNSGLRAFRRDVAMQYLHLLPRGFSCVTTITMAFLANGYSVQYMDIDYSPRAGTSKFHWWSDTRRYLQQVVRLTLMYEPLRIFGPAASLLGLIGAGKVVSDLIYHDLVIAGSTLVILGTSGLLLMLGVMADLIVQINKRPQSVIPAQSGQHLG